MMSKETVREEIQSHQEAIDKLESELATVEQLGLTESVHAIKNKLSYLRDNQYRYILQGKAMGMTFYTGGKSYE